MNIHQNRDKQNHFIDHLSINVSQETQFASLTLQNTRFSKISEAGILLVEYLQLFSQIFLLALNIWNPESSDDSVSGVIISFLKLLNPGSLFVLQGRKDVVIGCFVVSLVITIYKYLNFLYMIYTIARKVDSSPILAKTWTIAFQLQGRVLYSFITSIWVSILIPTLQDKSDPLGFGKIGNLVILIGLLLIEFIFCLVLRLRYYTILPTKGLLSSKTPAIEAITLTQKFTLQILQLIFAASSYMDGWIIASLCLIITLARSSFYLKSLPLYHLKGLYLQGVILMIITSLDVACFFQKIARPGDAFYFIVIVWILLSVLLIRICWKYIEKGLLDLASGNVKYTSSGLVQKINLIKQLRRKNKDDFLHLANSAIILKLINSLKTEEYPRSKDQLYNIITKYLESTQAVFPKDVIINLYKAELLAKKQLYGPALSSLTHLRRSPNHTVAINASLIILRIQKIMKKKSATTKSKISIHEYLSVQTQYMHAQNKILEQTGLQMSLYQEMIRETPDLSKIFNQGQTVDEWRQKIEKEINLLMKNIPEYYLSPLIMCSYYHLIANHSLADFTRYLKVYSHRKVKYAKSFQCEDITAENSFEENNAFILVSGQKESLGKISFCTESLAKIYGGDTNLYLGADISVIAPINSSVFSSLFSASSSVDISQSIVGNGFKGQCHNKAGHVIELDFYIDVFPILTNGFYYCILIRQISTQESQETAGLITLHAEPILYNTEKEPDLQIASEPEEPLKVNSEYEKSVESDIEEGHITKINSTSWKPKAPHKGATTEDNEIDDIKDLNRLVSQRTEAGFLSKISESHRNPQKLIEMTPDSTDNFSGHRGNRRKNQNYSIDDENGKKLALNSSQEKVSQAFSFALTRKYCWRPLRIAYIVFYLFLLGILIAQGILKSQINDTMNDLKTKKDILRNALLRDSTSVNIARASWFIIDQYTGIFNVTAVSKIGLKMSTFLINVNSQVKTLIDTNQAIQTNAGLLSESLRPFLFEPDIKLYLKTANSSLEATTTMTNFQATDHLAQSILKAVRYYSTNLNRTVNLLNVVVQNSLNELLVKIESTTQVITDSIGLDTQEKKLILKISFVAFTVGLVVMSFVLFRIVFLIYTKEKSNVLTLIKLDTIAISKLHSRLEIFKKVLETGNFVENKHTLRSLQVSVSVDSQRKFKNKSNFQSVKSGGTMKKYLLYISGYITICCIIIALMAWSSFSASESVRSLSRQQTRMGFSLDCAKTNLLAFVAFQLLYSTLGAAKIRNEPVGIQLTKSIKRLDDFRNQVISLFRNDDGNYDPLIAPIIFGHDCKAIFIPGTVVTNCAYVANRQRKLGLVPILSDYETLLTSLNDSYYSSNKTLAALQAIRANDFDMFISTHRVALDEANKMANLTNDIFEQKFSQAQDQANLILLILAILIPLLAYLTWIFTFKQLGESDNKFKNVLKNFPASLILSNYLLKVYLLKTSRSALDPVRSHL